MANNLNVLVEAASYKNKACYTSLDEAASCCSLVGCMISCPLHRSYCCEGHRDMALSFSLDKDHAFHIYGGFRSDQERNSYCTRLLCKKTDALVEVGLPDLSEATELFTTFPWDLEIYFEVPTPIPQRCCYLFFSSVENFGKITDFIWWGRSERKHKVIEGKEIVVDKFSLRFLNEESQAIKNAQSGRWKLIIFRYNGESLFCMTFERDFARLIEDDDEDEDDEDDEDDIDDDEDYKDDEDDIDDDEDYKEDDEDTQKAHPGISLTKGKRKHRSGRRDANVLSEYPNKGVKVGGKQRKVVTNSLFERRPEHLGISGALQEPSRYIKWPKAIRLQRQKRILEQRLKVPPALDLFTKSLDKNLATSLFKILLKYSPEEKAAKKDRLLKKAQAESEAKPTEAEKKPIVVNYGLKHVTYLIEQKEAQLVVIAQDVDPIELVVSLPALCRTMEVPYCIVKGKSRLGKVVHHKTVSCLCLTALRDEDKLEFSKILEAIESNSRLGKNLKEELENVNAQLEGLRKRKAVRMNRFNEVIDQLLKLSVELGNPTDDLKKFAAEETDLSFQKLDDLRKQLTEFQKEKSKRLEEVEQLLKTLNLLCLVLGEDFKDMIEVIHPSLVDSNTRDVSRSTLDKLDTMIVNLREVKLERMQKVQDLAVSLLELWKLLDTPEVEQRIFQNVTCIIESDITEVNILSVASIKRVEDEVIRLSKLKTAKVKEVILRKKLELEEISRKMHMATEVLKSENFSIEAIESGVKDPEQLLEQIDSEIAKVKEEASSRKEILEKVEKWILACKEESWLEEYNRDDNRYNAGRGAHLTLKRAEKARILVNKLPGMVEALTAEVTAWEDERGNEFLYDGVRVLTMLDEYKTLMGEKELEKQRQRGLKKLHGQLITEQEALYGSKPTPVKSGKNAAMNRKLSLGGDLKHNKRSSNYYDQNANSRRNSTLPIPSEDAYTALDQFTKSLDKNLATRLFKILLKYSPEAKKDCLLKKAQAESEAKPTEAEKPIVINYGLKHVTYLIEQKEAQLVVIAQDIDPIELVVSLPALCRTMEVPYCIVKGKSSLGKVVHQKTASCLCLTTVRNEDKLEFSKILEAIKANFNDKYDEYNRNKWGGGIIGSTSQA